MCYLKWRTNAELVHVLNRFVEKSNEIMIDKTIN